MVASREPTNDTVAAIALVIIPPITVKAVAKNPAIAEMIGASAITIIVPNVENAPTTAVMIVEQTPAMTVPTAVNADATTEATDAKAIRIAPAII